MKVEVESMAEKQEVVQEHDLQSTTRGEYRQPRSGRIGACVVRQGKLLIR